MLDARLVPALVLGLLVCFSPLARGQSDDVSFLVMGKTRNDRQSATGELTLLNYHFFAEIFVRSGGRVSEARLEFPGGGSQPFEDMGIVFELHGGRYQEESELDRAYPNGDYRFHFVTDSGPVDGRVMRVRGTGGERSRIPRPPRISLEQAGRAVSPLEVDPELDLEVSWTSFEKAGVDPNGILDDLLFVVMGDCRGEKTVHSGRPFEGTGHLRFDVESYVIAAKELAPGEAHQLFVEHAYVDTSEEDGVVGLVTYAATTFLDLRTQGAPTRNCPAEMPKIDGGQTDRRER